MTRCVSAWHIESPLRWNVLFRCLFFDAQLVHLLGSITLFFPSAPVLFLTFSVAFIRLDQSWSLESSGFFFFLLNTFILLRLFVLFYLPDFFAPFFFFFGLWLLIDGAFGILAASPFHAPELLTHPDVAVEYRTRDGWKFL